METEDRELLNARIGQFLHVVLVRIRSYTEPVLPDEIDRREEINDLVDLVHNLPKFTVGLDEQALVSLHSLKSGVIRHLQRFQPNADPMRHAYLLPLELDAEAFWQRYRDRLWDWEPTANVLPQSA